MPPVTDEEIPFNIPDNWCWVRLGDICEMYTGDSIAETEKKSKYLGLADGFSYIATKDVFFDNRINYDNGVRIPFENTFRRACKGSVLMCIEGGSAGRKIAVTNRDVCFGNKLCNFTADKISNRYIYFYLQSPAFKKIFVDNVTGIIGGVSLKQLNLILFPLPSLAEQERIVEKLDALLSEVDELAKDERELVELEETFPRRMRNSLLQAAIQGKLTEQLPSDGDAHDLLRKICIEKAQLVTKKIKAEKPLPPITDDEIPFDLPDNWCWCHLGDICQINPRNKPNDENIDATFLPMTAINDGYGNGYNPLVRPWQEIKSGFTHFADGDVIFAKITPCFQNRKSVVVNGLTNGIGAGTTEIYVLRSHGKYINEKYLLYFVKNHQFITDGVATMKGTAGQQRISRDFVANYLFPLPPLAEQERIVKRLDELLPLCEV